MKKIRVGITGNRFSGKTKVSNYFKKLYIPVFDADLVIKFILKYNYEIIGVIEKELGSNYIKKDNYSVNISKVNRDNKFNEVLSIIKNEIFDSYKIFEEKNNSIYSLFKTNILYESGWDKMMNKSISVYAPYHIRIMRGKNKLKNRFHDEQTLYYMLNSEMDELDKNYKSKYVIHNYNELDIKKQVLEVDQKIIDAYIKSEQTYKHII